MGESRPIGGALDHSSVQNPRDPSLVPDLPSLSFPTMTLRAIARLQLLGAAVLFSTGGAAIKAADFTGWQIASLRSGFAVLALLCMAPAARRGWILLQAGGFWRAALVGVAYAACLTLFVLANRLTTAANTIFLQSTAPLYILILAPWLLKERIRKQDLGFMVAVGCGLALFFVGVEQPAATAPDPGRGNLVALASGLCWALAICGLRWLGLDERRGSPTAAVVAGNLIAFLVSFPLALPLGAHSIADWAIVGYLGVFQIALAYTFVTSAISHIPALEASMILLLEPVLNPIWAWLVQREAPGVWALLGGAIILGATTLKSWSESRVAAT
jgi:drug/metabolite transporter, DME family